MDEVPSTEVAVIFRTGGEVILNITNQSQSLLCHVSFGMIFLLSFSS